MTDIFQIVRGSVPLEGVAKDHDMEFDQNNKAICPFHDDSRPSFHNYGDYGYCFGRHMQADVTALEAHFNHLPPYQAALNLAQRYGVVVPRSPKEGSDKFDKQARAYELLDKYSRRASDNLKGHPEVLDFLRDKGLDEKDIDRCLIGYVGNESPITSKALNLTSEEIELAKEVGLINGDKDYYRNRIILPVWSYGRVVFLTGRSYPDGEPKYLHLSNTDLLHKQLAFKENLRRDLCIITESILDAIAFIKAGFPACALIGTSANEKGDQPLSRARAKLYFALDPDEAGTKAAYQLAKEYKGFILETEYDKDYDEVLAEIGVEDFRKVIEKAIEDCTFYLDKVIEDEPIVEALKEIAILDMESQKDIWISRLAHRHRGDHITVNSLRADLKTIEAESRKLKSAQQDSESERDPLELLRDLSKSIHPAMEFIDGMLIYGTTIGADAYYITSSRTILSLDEISGPYNIADSPIALRFSPAGIRNFVNGDTYDWFELFTKIYALLSNHVKFKDKWQTAIVAIWIFGTYLHRCFPLFPYLWIQSPTKRCGKTRLLEIISALSFNSLGVETAPTEAVLFRLPAKTAGTLCWDEAENLHNHAEKGERLSVLNVAHRKGAKISRFERQTNEVKQYEVYRPVAIAGISYLPDTVSDRSIKVQLIRKRHDEKVARLQIERMDAEIQILRDQLHIFALERAPRIVEQYEQLPDKLIPEGTDDRLRDGLEVLFSIAIDIIPNHTQQYNPAIDHLKKAAKELSGVRSSEEDETNFVRSIEILKEWLEESGRDEAVLTSIAAVTLFQSRGLEWVQETKHARQILKRLEFRSATHRVSGNLIRGYKVTLTQVEDLHSRYGVNSGEIKSVTPVTA